MASSRGMFVWHELMTGNVDAARAFYCGVVGWRAEEAGMPDCRYLRLMAGEVGMGGLMPLPAGATAGWIGYIAVDDVDAAARDLTTAGGTIHRAPDDIPGIGRFAVVADPQGAAFVLFRGTGQSPERPAQGTPGHVGWNELHAADWETVFPFYGGLFGWQKAEAMDMGAMGTYQLVVAQAEPVGAMMTGGGAGRGPSWLFYFNVEAIEAAARRVSDGGGQVMHGPHEVPGGSWIVQCADPQGVPFALVAPRR